ncbi:putative glycoside hydrolase [Cohnella suwonensis]|uniref:Glycoside hydrolase n=1 Tax=Cohnella suwonensis TaxID=696072 RepID=A0ABW0LWW5_9BACL
MQVRGCSVRPKLLRAVSFLIVIVLSTGFVSGCSSDDPTTIKKQSLTDAGRSKLTPDASIDAKQVALKAKASKEDSIPVTLSSSKQPIRAIYVTSHVANGSRIRQLIDLVKNTELNAMVVDVNSGISLVAPTRDRHNTPDYTTLTWSERKSSRHFRQMIKQLKDEGIYLIARIVTFKNPELSKAMPSWAIKRKDGSVWRDRNGTSWIDPYRQEAWEYPLALAEKVVQLGFDEVQYDYVRFPENEANVDKIVSYENDEGWNKSEAIRKFLHRANVRAHKYGARVSADVFGMVGSSDDDMGIGQKWDSIAREVDIISPMVYPSHYSEGMWGIDHPDHSPGVIVAHALEDAVKRNRRLNGKGVDTAKVRPWLQGFTAGWVHPHQKYNEKEIREQIVAARKAGINSYMIWNSSSSYPKFTT